jgi:hypothetical protein
MSQPVIYDASALLALFEANEQAYRRWQRSDDGRTTVVFPAAAVADANNTLCGSYDDWSPLLWAKGAAVAPLDGSAAVESGRLCQESLSVAHVVHEARAMRGIVLTTLPQIYRDTAVPVLVL